jgi:hypothetical protein
MDDGSVFHGWRFGFSWMAVRFFMDGGSVFRYRIGHLVFSDWTDSFADTKV